MPEVNPAHPKLRKWRASFGRGLKLCLINNKPEHSHTI